MLYILEYCTHALQQTTGRHTPHSSHFSTRIGFRFNIMISGNFQYDNNVQNAASVY